MVAKNKSKENLSILYQSTKCNYINNVTIMLLRQYIFLITDFTLVN